MRLDKFLKISRLIKRRTLAKEISDQGRITVNGVQAKAGTRVAVGDKLTIRFGQKLVTVNVLALRENVRKEEAETLYEVVAEERMQEEDENK